MQYYNMQYFGSFCLISTFIFGTTCNRVFLHYVHLNTYITDNLTGKCVFICLVYNFWLKVMNKKHIQSQTLTECGNKFISILFVQKESIYSLQTTDQVSEAKDLLHRMKPTVQFPRPSWVLYYQKSIKAFYQV